MQSDPPQPPTTAPEDPAASLEAQLSVLEAQVLHLQAVASQARGLFQDSPGAALLLTDQGRIQDVNVRGAALLGSARTALLGRSLSKVLPAASQVALTSLLGHVFEERGQRRGEIQLLTSSGDRLELVIDLVLHQGGDQDYLCHVTLTDVTAFKLAHQAIWDAQQAQDAQRHHQAAQLRQLQAEFESVMLASGRALEDTLTRARSVLADATASPDAWTHLDDSLRQAQGLLDSLKRYMQLRFMRTRLRSVNLNQVLRDVLKDVADQWVGRDVRITTAPLPTVSGDSQALQLILHEYVHNALKFTRTRPQATLRVVLQEDAFEYRIGVEDNGIGFNMRQKEKAFELFGRLHADDHYEGTGLGLAVVRRLCERFGGRAWGEGKVDQGATFWFAWPKTPQVK